MIKASNRPSHYIKLQLVFEDNLDIEIVFLIPTYCH